MTPGAKEAYTRKAKEIKALIEKIESGLEQHAQEQKESPRNWGYVGDLAYYAEQLQNISDSLHGEGEYKE